MTILDKKLDKISSTDNLAKGESIYSARFMGETGYFVTYEIEAYDMNTGEKTGDIIL